MTASITATTSTASVRGSTRWMAIELLDVNLEGAPSGTKPAEHTKETDVWAYGMVIYELLTGEVPFQRLKHDVQVSMAIISGHKPRLPLGIPDTFENGFLWQTCQPCWETTPAHRPKMHRICDAFTDGVPIQPPVRGRARSHSHVQSNVSKIAVFIQWEEISNVLCVYVSLNSQIAGILRPNRRGECAAVSLPPVVGAASHAGGDTQHPVSIVLTKKTTVPLVTLSIPRTTMTGPGH